MNKLSLRRPLSVMSLCAALAVLGGCATASRPEAMIPTTVDAGTHHAQSVAVAVTGGSETSALGKSQISNGAFQQALVSSIQKAGTFSSVVQGQGGDCLLAVTVVSMDQPSFGLTFTVKMEAAWSLKKADGTVLMQESIKSEGTATPGDALAAVERLRLANEAAARNNIAAGLGKIGKLDF